MREANLLQAFIASEYWEALECIEALATLKIPLLTLIPALTNDLWYLLKSSPQEIQDLSYEFSQGIHSVAYFQSFHSSSDELEEDTFLSLVVE